jgi:hypothetical protein
MEGIAVQRVTGIGGELTRPHSMNMLDIAFEAITAVLGGLAAALVLTWLGWTAFKVVRHPEWGPPAMLVLLVAVSGGALRSSDFLRMVVLFSAIAGMLVWAEGGDWRERHKIKRTKRESRCTPFV